MKVKTYQTLTTDGSNENIETIQQLLALHGPLASSIDSSSFDFYFYESGIYEDTVCSTSEPNLSIVIIGYGYDSNNKPYFICQNSWGTNWGEDGFFRIYAEGNTCGILSSILYLTEVQKLI